MIGVDLVPQSRSTTDSTSNHSAEIARRLELARGIAPAYAQSPAVAAIFGGGSVARGYADRWSDLELGIFWHSRPTHAQRRAAIERIPADDYRVFSVPGPNGALEEDFIVAGTKVDIVHLTHDAVERILVDVTETGDPDLAKQVLLSVLRSAVPLHGQALLDDIRVRAAAYPDALVRAMVTKHLIFGPHAYLTMLAERGDTLFLSELLCRVARSVLGVLFGLNRVYPPSTDSKWAPRAAADLAIAPTNLLGRLPHILRGDPIAAVSEAQRLIDETISLVEAHLPALDTRPIRTRVNQPNASFSDQSRPDRGEDR